MFVLFSLKFQCGSEHKTSVCVCVRDESRDEASPPESFANSPARFDRTRARARTNSYTHTHTLAAAAAACSAHPSHEMFQVHSIIIILAPTVLCLCTLHTCFTFANNVCDDQTADHGHRLRVCTRKYAMDYRMLPKRSCGDDDDDGGARKNVRVRASAHFCQISNPVGFQSNRYTVCT